MSLPPASPVYGVLKGRESLNRVEGFSCDAVFGAKRWNLFGKGQTGWEETRRLTGEAAHSEAIIRI